MAFAASRQILRSFSTSMVRAAAVDKLQLSKLRKATGYGMSNCKDALIKNDHDFAKASAWLAEQAQTAGWAKATKLSGRPATQGLVGVAVSGDRRRAVVLECRCETDFVARNSVFIDTVGEMTTKILADTTALSDAGVHKTQLSAATLATTAFDASTSLSDRLALAIGLCGENMVLGRAVQMTAGPSQRLYGITHGGAGSAESVVETPMLGTYGGLVAVEGEGEDADVMRSLCMQVIGMKPKYVGTKEQVAEFQKSLEARSAQPTATEAATTVGTSREPTAEASAEESSQPEDENEAPPLEEKTPRDDFLTLQAWMKDEDLSVGEVMDQQGVQVLDFLRFKLGEDEAV